MLRIDIAHSMHTDTLPLLDDAYMLQAMPVEAVLTAAELYDGVCEDSGDECVYKNNNVFQPACPPPPPQPPAAQLLPTVVPFVSKDEQIGGVDEECEHDEEAPLIASIKKKCKNRVAPAKQACGGLVGAAALAVRRRRQLEEAIDAVAHGMQLATGIDVTTTDGCTAWLETIRQRVVAPCDSDCDDDDEDYDVANKQAVDAFWFEMAALYLRERFVRSLEAYDVQTRRTRIMQVFTNWPVCMRRPFSSINANYRLGTMKQVRHLLLLQALNEWRAAWGLRPWKRHTQPFLSLLFKSGLRTHTLRFHDMLELGVMMLGSVYGVQISDELQQTNADLFL